MDRCDLRWPVTAAAALTTILFLAGHASAEMNGGSLGANHRAAIDNTAPLGLDADVEQERAEHPPKNEQSTKETQPLVEAGDTAALDAITRSMSAEQYGVAPDESERSIGLFAPGADDPGSSRLALPIGGDNDFIQVAGALAIVITLLLVFRFVMVRASNALAGGRPSGVLEILARYPVARGQHLSLIKLGRRILLVHQNGSAMNTLSEVSDPNEVAALLSRIEAGASGRDAARFRSLLTQYQREHETLGTQAGTKPRSAAAPGPESTRDERGEIIDLTRSQMGGLRNLFGTSGGGR